MKVIDSPASFSLRGVDKCVFYRAYAGAICYFCEGGATPAHCRVVELVGVKRKSRVLRTGSDLLHKVEPPCESKRQRTVCLRHMHTMIEDCAAQRIRMEVVDGYTEPAPK